jgi:hypothetical protein
MLAVVIAIGGNSSRISGRHDGYKQRYDEDYR